MGRAGLEPATLGLKEAAGLQLSRARARSQAGFRHLRLTAVSARFGKAGLPRCYHVRARRRPAGRWVEARRRRPTCTRANGGPSTSMQRVERARDVIENLVERRPLGSRLLLTR